MARPITQEEMARRLLQRVLDTQKRRNALWELFREAKETDESARESMRDWMQKERKRRIILDGWLVVVNDKTGGGTSLSIERLCELDKC